MDTDGPDAADDESDLLLGILDILDPELFLKSCEEPPVFLVDGGEPVPAAAPAPLGPPSIKLETLNGLIHLDHIYTKPAEVAAEDAKESDDDDDDGCPLAFLPVAEVVVEDDDEEEDVCVKDEPEEVLIPRQMDDFLCAPAASTSPALSGADKEACPADAHSDSGYEGSPSPFSDMSSPLCSDSPWDDMFANELFPQLISV